LFLAPEIVKAVIDGRLPLGVEISRLSDLPASWREQFRQALESRHPRRIHAYIARTATESQQEPQQNHSARRMRVICKRIASEVIIFAGSS
jgi:hypothetical protein